MQTEPGNPSSEMVDRVSALLAEVLETEVGSQPEVLARLCAQNPGCAAALRQGYGSLQDLDLLQIGQVSPAVPDFAPGTGGLPRVLGPFRLLELLGTGGMGTVFRAEDEELQRPVALKLVRGELLASARTRFRFQREAAALARLDHPGLCTVYRAGSTDGQPWIAMRLVRGTTLAASIEARRRPQGDGTRRAGSSPRGSSRSREEVQSTVHVFEKIARALHTAHAAGVVHRDIKPANIVLTGAGEPVVIDFGLVHLEDSESHLTISGDHIGTPAYMAPEQVEPAGREPGPHTDVFALGITLFEALTLESPYQAGSREELYHCIVRGKRRRLRQARRGLPADLELVLEKALDLDPAQRYASTVEFADDLRRYLAHEPLVAGPPSAWYRARKLVRRYPGQVLAASMVLVALLGGGIATFLQYLRAEDKAAYAEQQKAVAEANEAIAKQNAEENAKLAREKGDLAAAEANARQEAQRNADAAETRARVLEQVLKFQEAQWSEADTARMGAHLRRGLLAEADEAHRAPLAASTAGVNFTDLALGMLQENLFERSLAAIGNGFAEQPIVKARLLQSVADTLRELGLLARATAPQTEALEIRRRSLGDDHEDTLTSIASMALLLADQGKLEEAEPFAREALEKRCRVLGDEHPDTLRSINNMGTLLQAQGRLDEAESLERALLETRRRTLGDNHPDTATSFSNMGVLLQSQGKLAEAEPFTREALDKSRIAHGDEHPDTLTSVNNLGALLKALGRLDEAEPLLREALESRRRVLGGDHADTLASLGNLGFLLEARGKLREAEPFHRESLERSRANLGDEHPNTVVAITTLGSLLLALGRLTEAEPLCREAMETSRRVLGIDHHDTLGSISTMSALLKAQGRLAEAEPLRREALEGLRRMFGNDHPSTLVAISNMGSLLVAQSKFAEAEVLRREALEGFRRVLGDDHENTLISINNLGSMLQGQGKFAEAEPYLREALETSSRVLGKYHPTTLAALVNMGGLLEEQGKHTEAEPYFREALASNMRVLGADHINTLASVEWLSGLYSQTGRHREAAELMSAAEESARKVYAGRRAALASFLAKLGRACAASGQPKDFAAGAQRLREAHSLFTDSLGPAHQEVHDSAQALVGLYQAWHAIEPGDGHDKEAAEWHAKLELAAPKVEKEPAR